MDQEAGLSPRALATLGWIASFAAIAMYVSYLDQIARNLAGEKGSYIQPLATVINASLWIAYGALRQPRRDWPIILANAPGVALGAVAFVTAIV